MGRQTQLHMIGEDVHEFLRIASATCELIVTRRYDDVAAINPVIDSALETDVALWNRDIQPSLARRRIALNDGGERFCIDNEEQTLELLVSGQVIWNGRPGLLQGRVYGWNFQDRPKYAKWFDSIQRRVRKDFRKNPFSFGFIGPEAWKFFLEGGVILPFFAPPLTDVWLAEIAKQDSVRPTQML